jgi:hypothetical protein
VKPAPRSPRSVKLRSNAAATAPNPSAVHPEVMAEIVPTGSIYWLPAIQTEVVDRIAA